MKPLAFQNIFGRGFEPSNLERYRSLGFALRPQASDFAGAQHLRFIDFTAGPCLELGQDTHRKAYQGFVPLGMVPYAPGLNLVLQEGAQVQLDTYHERFTSWGPYRLHENYQGGQG